MVTHVQLAKTMVLCYKKLENTVITSLRKQGVNLIASQIFAAVQERKAGYVSIYANTTGGLLLW